MDTTLIPWDFLALLAAVFAVAALTVCCAYALKAWRRTRLTDPRKDHVYTISQPDARCVHDPLKTTSSTISISEGRAEFIRAMPSAEIDESNSTNQ